MGKLKAEYRALANPKKLQQFLNRQGATVQRQALAEQYNYDWHARKLTFESHFRGPWPATRLAGR